MNAFQRDVLKAFAYTGYCKFLAGEEPTECVAPRISAQGIAAHDEAGVDEADWAHRILLQLEEMGLVAFVTSRPRVHTRAVLTPKGRRVVATGFVHDEDYDMPLPAVDDQTASKRHRYATLLFAHSDVEPPQIGE